ncbi:MAG: hypothetical protein CBC84_003305 [Pelagibacteraceae bacterium TMED124]|nr:hypothetical protein [Rickettsiales bacterium]RPG16343.1 MAG: hypothetical protein CBC84_003305 [Pelagibacteraceae bacterium TMED124]|tara:strand:- start:1934 stop:2377 length:444 start_codon:yes stop_codon:yes gene_type:complete
MSNITFQIIPFAFIFVVILFFLAKKKNIKKEIIVQKDIPLNDYGEHKEFFENAEKKLVALRELYRQELIDIDIYVKKTELVAQSISKLTGKNVKELVETKNDHIYKRLKSDISKKIEKIPSKKSIRDLDKLISDVDKRIEMGLNYER